MPIRLPILSRDATADLQAAGYGVIRITWHQLTSRPEAVAARLAVALRP